MSGESAVIRAVWQRHPSDTVFRSRGEVMPAWRVRDSIERAAATLQRAGVRILAIAADNSPDWVIADLGARLAGIPVVPVPPFFSPGQVEHLLADSGADAVATDVAGGGLPRPVPTWFAVEFGTRMSLVGIEPMRQSGAVPDGTVRISYTSGTTGRPKGVCLTRAAEERVACGLVEVTSDVGIGRHLCLLPLATLLENLAGVYAPLIAGAEVALPALGETGLAGAAGVDASQLLDCLHRYEPESVILLPELLSVLVRIVEHGGEMPVSLKFAAVGGGVVGSSLLERADRIGLPVYEGYGLTECGSVVALNTPAARRIGSVGRPLPHCRIRIGDESEVFVRGASHAGYLGQPHSDHVEIGTGDTGYLDDDGYLFINGRKKNVFITSFGRNLSPEWVEASLIGRDSIAQAVLYGDGRPYNIAVIVPATEASADGIDKDVAAVNTSLPDYARIRRWVAATEPFSARNRQATDNGRVRRDAVQVRYGHEIDACYR